MIEHDEVFVGCSHEKLETIERGRRYPVLAEPRVGGPNGGQGVMLIDDGALVEALRSGDSRAPRVLIERYQGIVFGLCLRMLGNRHDAEDVVQETFLRALRGIASFDNGRPLRPWLLGIASNRCRTALGHRARRPGLSESVEEQVDHRPGLADPDDLAGELSRALNQLRPEYRLVFALFHEQNLGYEEIGQALGRPVGTIKTWLHRARAELADHLSRRGVWC
jgi:RNA polymerase sigma factor (sigma-70 family)